MIAGIVPHPTPIPSPQGALIALSSKPNGIKQSPTPITPTTLTSFLVIAYTPPETFVDEMTDDRARQARKTAERPELRIISRAGEELTADALTLANYQHLSCNDYVVEVSSDDQQSLDADKGRCYVVMSPNDLVLVKPRDRRDHVMWLVERRRYEEALDEVESFLEADGNGNSKEEDEAIVQEIRRKYIHHLVHEGCLFFPPLLNPC